MATEMNTWQRTGSNGFVLWEGAGNTNGAQSYRETGLHGNVALELGLEVPM